ncbi:MAG: SDR family oxidoreductase, partial [Burkholderiaceae bacterium]|nr:SDR family oxidoreductase [Burkholderiaceae bacterium]
MNDNPLLPGDLGLRDRVVVVTGAGGGIGRAIARGFAEAGARVAVLGRSAEGLCSTVDEIERAGGQARAITCDVSSAASVAEAAERSAAAFGPCDILVNNAGVIIAGALETLSLDAWNNTIGINLTGCFLCSQAFFRQMRTRGSGALVHVASIGALHAAAQAGAYSVTKAGIAMLSRQLALEWSTHGIRSNVVNPGMTLTPLTQARYETPGTMERMSSAIPAGRIGRPQDIAEAVLFLASDRAAYITGQEITVDGGFTNMLMSLVPRGDYLAPTGQAPGTNTDNERAQDAEPASGPSCRRKG